MSFQRLGELDHFLLCREWLTLRMRVLERDGGKCSACGRSASDNVVINVDHIKPRGLNPELALTIDNLQVLCAPCNQGKGNKFETDWRRPGKPRPATGTQKEEAERARQLELVRRLTQKDGNAEPMAERGVLHKSEDQRSRGGSP